MPLSRSSPCSIWSLCFGIPKLSVLAVILSVILSFLYGVGIFIFFFCVDRGYGRSVVAIAIREVDEHIISVEKSHAVSVHSLKSQVCVQRFAGGDLLKLGKNPISSSFYNPVSSRFLMATTVLVKLGPDQTVNVPQVGSSSKAAVGVVYSPMYERVRQNSFENL